MRVGTSVVDMQTAGRWADPKKPAHYARAELAERGAVARSKYGNRQYAAIPKRAEKRGTGQI